MESFIFAVEAVSPIVLTVAIGYLLKRAGLMSVEMAKACNKLVFRLFLPVMLFLNVYKIENLSSIQLGYMAYTLLGVLALFLIAIPVMLLAARKRDRRGPVWQASFRSNFALIGIPLAQSLCGDEGVIVASLLSAATVPLLNVLAVISLSMFREGGERPSVKKILLGILKNPLIQAIAAGLLMLAVRGVFVEEGIAFRLSDIKPVYTVLGYLSGLATPLALIGLGAQFEFSAIGSLRREILAGTLMRTLVSPVLGLGVAVLFFRDHFSAAHFASLVAVFATPVSVSSAPMAQEMGNDAALAGQLVVWTTLVSAISIFFSSFVLRLIGIF
ncbi:MAG: AEC family transporter [Ruminococcaceae bacterium]|nr:AEC family transporter [Oscillospiraceae bacterium]